MNPASAHPRANAPWPGPALPAHVALAGPTASGKTALALELARRWPLEIISVDSALVYRGLDVGAAKPTPAQQAQVPHHLLDVRDPLQPYSAADFVRDARRTLHAVAARGRLPLLVGGTMLYFRALYQGLDDLPPADPAVRQAIQHQAQQRGWPALHAQLAQVDPATAARLPPTDAQRIGRALEVWHQTGRPISALHTLFSGAENPDSARATNPKDWSWPENVLFLSLEPSDRAWLHERVAQRLQAMRREGFLREVRALYARGDLNPDLPALRSVGYRQAWAALQALGPEAGDDALWAHLWEPALAATRQLAKRQITWLRSQPRRITIACDAADVQERACGHVATFLRAQPPGPKP